MPRAGRNAKKTANKRKRSEVETNEEAEAGQNGDRHDYADAEDEAEVIECMQEDAAEEAEAEQNGDRDDYDDAEDEAEGNEWKQENAEEEAEAEQNGDSNDYFDAEDEAGTTKWAQENAPASGKGDEAQTRRRVQSGTKPGMITLMEMTMAEVQATMMEAMEVRWKSATTLSSTVWPVCSWRHHTTSTVLTARCLVLKQCVTSRVTNLPHP